MARENHASHERCPEHDLAVGPAGECVLCRRTRARSGGRPRWLSPALTLAGLGTLLLGGVALARTRTPVPPVVEVAPVENVRPVLRAAEAPAALAAAPVAVAETETRPCEPQAVAPPVAAPAPPQRNYLDEAYAAMPKAHLYDEPAASPHAAATHTGCACANGGCPPRVYLSSRPGYGTTRAGYGVPGPRMGVAVGQPMSGPRPPSGGGSGAAYRR